MEMISVWAPVIHDFSYRTSGLLVFRELSLLVAIYVLPYLMRLAGGTSK